MKTLYKFTIKVDENRTELYINNEKLPYSGYFGSYNRDEAITSLLRDLSQLALDMAVMAE